MFHLSPEEITELLDDTLVEARASHVDRCDDCRKRTDDARAAALLARETEVPEPSPLFWDHFSKRVSEAIAGEPVPQAPSIWRLAWMPLAATLVLIAAIAGGLTLWPPSAPVHTTRNEGDRVVPAMLPAPAGIVEELSVARGFSPADQEWGLVLDVADEADWDEAVEAGLQVSPGSAEAAALQLTVEERQELGRLLEAELTGSKVL